MRLSNTTLKKYEWNSTHCWTHKKQWKIWSYFAFFTQYWSYRAYSVSFFSDNLLLTFIRLLININIKNGKWVIVSHKINKHIPIYKQPTIVFVHQEIITILLIFSTYTAITLVLSLILIRFLDSILYRNITTYLVSLRYIRLFRVQRNLHVHISLWYVSNCVI